MPRRRDSASMAKRSTLPQENQAVRRCLPIGRLLDTSLANTHASADRPELSDYEKRRLENMERNQMILASLGLDQS
jgi:hypothetical protein